MNLFGSYILFWKEECVKTKEGQRDERRESVRHPFSSVLCSSLEAIAIRLEAIASRLYFCLLLVERVTSAS